MPNEDKGEQNRQQPSHGGDGPRGGDGGGSPPGGSPGPGPAWVRQVPWPLIFLALLLAALFWPMGFEQKPDVPYTLFKRELRGGNVERLVAEGESLRGSFRDAVSLDEPVAEGKEAAAISEFQTKLPPFADEDLMQEVMEQDLVFVSKGSGNSTLKLILINLLPLFLIFGLIIFMSRRASRQAGGLLSVGRSQAKKFEKERTSVTFEDVAGLNEAKESLKETVQFLTEPERFAKLGCRVPKGLLLVGPPGTGKTLLARATAGEAKVPFFSITGSDFVEMFVGVGASRVRDLFRIAKKEAPCIIFVDELDSVGRHRGAGVGGGHDEREQTLNQLLSEIDGFEPADNLVVMAATNRPDVLDPALLRPGRFDRQVTVDLPALSERIEILKVHSRKVPLDDDVDMADIARSMPGRSGADLSNLINEAALMAARHDKSSVSRQDFSEARDQILMGQLRGSIVLEGREKEAVAIHEAGHALTAHLTPEADRVEKISIIPRGRGLGATQQLPEERFNLTYEFLRARIKVMLGGRAAETIILGTVSTGAADDLDQATRLTRHMVGQWGMSETFANIAFEEHSHEVFLGEQIGNRRRYSEQTARDMDMEIKRMIDSCYAETCDLLVQHKKRLSALASVLGEKEVLEGAELERQLDGESERPEPEQEATEDGTE